MSAVSRMPIVITRPEVRLRNPAVSECHIRITPATEVRIPVGRKSNAHIRITTATEGLYRLAMGNQALKIDMAAYGWKVRTSPRRRQGFMSNLKMLKEMEDMDSSRKQKSDGAIEGDENSKFPYGSSILKEVQVLKSSGFDFLSYCSKLIGGIVNLLVFEELGENLCWMGDIPYVWWPPWIRLFGGSVEEGFEQQEFSDLRGLHRALAVVARYDFLALAVRSQNGTSGSLLFVFRVQLKVFWKESSTLLGGLFGDFGIVLLLMLISRLDRSFLRILSLPPFFGVIVGVVESSLGMIGLKTRI
ncbi:hypothetical protein Tco_0271888 [Tanacetum coccineum]